jgi:hypothetical protein
MTDISRQKRAEFAGSTGAGVLGLGIGALLAEWAAPYALFLVIVGILLHGWGMLEKRRLEAGSAVPPWSNALYWLCWIGLGILVAWIGIAVWKG